MKSDFAARAGEPRHRARFPTARAESAAAFERDTLDSGGHLGGHHNIRPVQVDGGDDRLVFGGGQQAGAGKNQTEGPGPPAERKRVRFHSRY